MQNISASVVILTKNEADNIKKCLLSCLDFQQILLIDNSTDQTVAIAQKLIKNDKLEIIKSNSDDFAYLRNLGLNKANNDWVLFLDADEIVTLKLKTEINYAVQQKKYAGFYIPRKDYFLGKWLKYGETGNIKLLKLGRRNAGKWTRRVHEVWNIQGQVGYISQSLLHFPHPTISEFVSRINRWTTFDAEVFYKQGEKVYFWKIIFYPLGKFMLNYFIKLGFLDGIPGLFMAILMSFHSFLTRGKLYFLLHNSDV